jgi:hypothetical protein
MNRLMNQTAYVERLLGKTRMSAHTWSLSRTCRFICQTLLIFLLGTTMAHATCTCQNGAGPLSYTYTIPQLTVPRDAAIGTVLYSAQTEATPATGVYMSCNSNDSWSYTVSGGPRLPAVPVRMPLMCRVSECGSTVRRAQPDRVSTTAPQTTVTIPVPGPLTQRISA